MKTLPSKELLKSVLDIELSIEDIAIKENTLSFNINTDGWSARTAVHARNEYSINIYELMHLMKEWAIKQGYIIVEFPLMVRTTNISTQQNKIFNYTPQEELDKDYLKPEYIFKAGEWILKEIQK